MLIKETRLAVSAKNNLPTKVNRWVPAQRGSTPFFQSDTKTGPGGLQSAAGEQAPENQSVGLLMQQSTHQAGDKV